MRRWPLGLLTALVIAIAVAIAVGSRGTTGPAPTATPSAALGTAATPTTAGKPSRTSMPTPALSPSSTPPLPTGAPPPSPASASPSSPPYAVAQPTGLRWDAALETFEDPLLRLAPISWSGGFAALESRRGARLWLSTDGRSWSPHPLPIEKTGYGTSLVAFRDGLVLDNPHSAASPGTRHEIWMSRDGDSWDHWGSVTTAAETPGYGVWGTLTGLDDKLAILAHVSPLGSGGARPANSPPGSRGDGDGRTGSAADGDAEARSDELGMWVWTSDDGRAWHRQRVRGVGTDIVSISDRTGDSYVGVRAGMDGRGWIAHSVDGIRWRTLAALPGDIDPYSGAYLAATDDGYVLAADTSDRSGVRQRPELTVWQVSGDGAFRSVLVAPGQQVYGLAAQGQSVVLVGFQEHGLSGIGRTDPIAVTSTDGGRTFDLSAHWPSLDATDCLRNVAIHDEAVVAGGGCDIRDGPELYVAELP